MASPDQKYEQARREWGIYIDLGTFGDDPENIDEAAGSLEAALKADPEHIPSLRMLALLLTQLGATEEAREFSDRLLRLRPDDAGAQELARLLRQGSREGQLGWLVGVWHGGEY